MRVFIVKQTDENIIRWLAGEIINREQNKEIFVLGKKVKEAPSLPSEVQESNKNYNTLTINRDNVDEKRLKNLTIKFSTGIICIADEFYSIKELFISKVNAEIERLIEKYNIGDLDIKINNGWTSTKINNRRIFSYKNPSFNGGKYYYGFVWSVFSVSTFIGDYYLNKPHSFDNRIIVDVDNTLCVPTIKNNMRLTFDEHENIFSVTKNVINLPDCRQLHFIESRCPNLPFKYSLILFYSQSFIGLRQDPSDSFIEGQDYNKSTDDRIIYTKLQDRYTFGVNYKNIKFVYKAKPKHIKMVNELINGTKDGEKYVHYIRCKICRSFLFDEIYIVSELLLYCPICVHKLTKHAVKTLKKIYKVKIPITLEFLLDNLNISDDERYIYNNLKSYQFKLHEYYRHLIDDTYYLEINNILIFRRFSDFLAANKKIDFGDKKIIFTN